MFGHQRTLIPALGRCCSAWNACCAILGCLCSISALRGVRALTGVCFGSNKLSKAGERVREGFAATGSVGRRDFEVGARRRFGRLPHWAPSLFGPPSDEPLSRSGAVSCALHCARPAWESTKGCPCLAVSAILRPPPLLPLSLSPTRLRLDTDLTAVQAAASAMCVARRWCATSRYASVAHELVSFVSLDAGASSPLHTRLFIHRRSQYVSEHRSRYVVPSSSSSRLCRYVSQGLHRVGRRRVRVHARKGGKQSIRECVHPPSSSDSFYRASECARADRPRYVLPDRIGFARPAHSRTVVPKPCRAGPRPRTRASALLRCRTARGRVAGRALLVAGSLHAGSQRRRGSARGAGRRARVDARAGRCVQKSRRGACERI